ncbi:MAG: M15 family metallopeptidase [Chloroflexota bacterium]
MAHRHRVRGRYRGALLAAAVAALGVLPATGAAAASRVPACRVGDAPAPYQAKSQFRVTILDTWFRLPASYAPPVASVRQAGFPSGGSVRRDVIPDLRALRAAARAAGLPIGITSAYRSASTQAWTFAHWVRVGGYAQAIRTSARPGHSEHQLGTAIDFTIPGALQPWRYADWGRTRTGSWLRANAWRFGFVLSYPPGEYARSCYSYEPWHYRWVGRELARRIDASGLVPRVWLWRNAAPAPRPSPTPEPEPTLTPTPTPTPEPEPEPEPALPSKQVPEPTPTPEPTHDPTLPWPGDAQTGSPGAVTAAP